jgi:hypothetical protein
MGAPRDHRFRGLCTPGGANLPPVAPAAIVLFVLAIWAAANLVYVPAVCCDRAASWIATELSGSVRVGDRWS